MPELRGIIREISQLCDKYGGDFNWGIVPEKNGFVSELRKETDISQYSEAVAIARSYSCDDVLFLLDNSIFRIYHLTYSTNNVNGFPKPAISIYGMNCLCVPPFSIHITNIYNRIHKSKS